MTGQQSMLEYLASLRQHGCTPQNIGTAQIGRTVYAAGSFLQHDLAPIRVAPGHRGQRDQQRIALMPLYRTDYVTERSVGPTPELLPASYQRNRRTIFVTFDSAFYIAGYNEHDGVLWMNLTDGDSWMWDEHRRQRMEIHFREPFEVSLALASREVLARIEAQS